MALLEMQGMETRECGGPTVRGSHLSVLVCDIDDGIAIC